jgi:virginiamycin B lyase
MAASIRNLARWRCFDAPRGTGPYGIATTPDGQVFFASLAGNYLGQIDLESGGVTVLEPPVPRQGARRVWSDSRGGLWITGWNSGDIFRYDTKTKTWAHWHLPGDEPQPYAVYVDETDTVWVSDWGANAILRFDPRPKNSNPSGCLTATPACGSSRAARVKSGVPSPAPRNYSC